MANGTEDTLNPQDVMDEGEVLDKAVRTLMQREEMRSAMIALVRLQGLRQQIMGHVITLVERSYKTCGKRFQEQVMDLIELRAESLADAATADILKG